MLHVAGFGGLDDINSDYDDSSIVILPVPYDETSTWIKGADRGPDAIIKASAFMELYDIETGTEVYKHGIFTDSPVTADSSPESMVRDVYDRVTEHLNRGRFVVTLGGEHSVSIGAAAAHAEKYENMSVLQLDAHADLRDEYNNSRYNHACVMSRIREYAPITQVGIRSMDISEKNVINPERIFFAHDITKDPSWVEKVVSVLSDTVYITIDLDVFDISQMPATGTPEPGGLFWNDILSLLRTTARQKKIVGFDVVELCPGETSWPYDFMAAKLIYKALSYAFGEIK